MSNEIWAFDSKAKIDAVLAASAAYSVEIKEEDAGISDVPTVIFAKIEELPSQVDMDLDGSTEPANKKAAIGTQVFYNPKTQEFEENPDIAITFNGSKQDGLRKQGYIFAKDELEVDSIVEVFRYSDDERNMQWMARQGGGASLSAPIVPKTLEMYFMNPKTGALSTSTTHIPPAEGQDGLSADVVSITLGSFLLTNTSRIYIDHTHDHMFEVDEPVKADDYEGLTLGKAISVGEGSQSYIALTVDKYSSQSEFTISIESNSAQKDEWYEETATKLTLIIGSISRSDADVNTGASTYTVTSWNGGRIHDRRQMMGNDVATMTVTGASDTGVTGTIDSGNGDAITSNATVVGNVGSHIRVGMIIPVVNKDNAWHVTGVFGV